MTKLNPKLAPTPPMGWNSFDCFGGMVTEAEVRANAEYLANHLKQHGYEYVVVDIEWYAPSFQPNSYLVAEPYTMDDYGRYIPATKRFPSAADGKGFKPLGDYIHSLGLKFGIHIMRGIPQQAVEMNLPVLGTEYNASDIADKTSICSWAEKLNYGIDPSKPGAQAYYDSILKLYTEWEVDFIKADDMSSPYAKGEIELLRRAIDNCGRPIVLSLSPGPAPIEETDHLKSYSEMWRLTGDVWDRWDCVETGFDICEKWEGVAEPGCWPDADMLPFGHIELRPAGHCIGERMTRLTKDEQLAFMTLWCIFRSPLMIGSNLPDLDPWTLSLLANDEVLEIVKHSHSNKQLYRREDSIAWTARNDNGDTYLAVFNTGTEARVIETKLSEMELSGNYMLRDLWEHCDLGVVDDVISAEVPGHGVRLYKIS